ncbi:MAG: DNA mismatch repair protein MutS [Deltaproteobacteria bacterium]|nr:MAG: DNA mismatch repair protein MutS [Deltaproteobacteria bacterium]
MGQLTPMLRQYLGIKEQYPDAILFFRMGDFYEMFFEDARIASRILGITLTSRGTYEGEKVPMCGVPHHASRNYVARLIEGGWKVAICDQVEDPKESKGIVKREVVRVVTPGSVVDEADVDTRENVYLAAVSRDKNSVFGLAHAELSTGEFRVTELHEWNDVLDELGRIGPAEVLIPEGMELLNGKSLSHMRLEKLTREIFEPGRAESLLKDQLGVPSLAGFGCEDMRAGIVAAGAIVAYLLETQKGSPEHMKEISTYRLGDYMFLDEATCTHLELVRTMRRHSVKGSLISILDRSVTPMGARLLRKWLSYPLVNLEKIHQRLAAVATLKNDPILREELREELSGVYDLERLNGRVALGRANARDLLALKNSLLILPRIKQRLADSPSILLADLAKRLDPLEEIAVLIEKSIHENPPLSLKEGGIIKKGYSEELDGLIALSRDGKKWIAAFAQQEQERTGISSLKVGYNRIYGYYIEVSKVNQHLVPEDYIRKQTLVNGERYITEPLKVMEEKVLGAEEKRVEMEFRLFQHIREQIGRENQRLKQTAGIVARIDVVAGLSEAAEQNHYACPVVDDGLRIDIRDGRHPVIEQTVTDEEFVPNDTSLDGKDQQVLIITGPNMAGKSTVLRQTALIVLMAQMGSFVPASKAEIGLVDRIFTRVGASDDLTKGRSTFMVEMNETANILRHATPRSLVILDEIGRGTSTFDGLSIAWAVAEALHDRDGQGVRTLFATHYHELTELVASKARVKNYNIAVKEWNNRIIFLRKLVPGGTSRSYGIQVARIAGVPEEVLKRAKEILDNLEGEDVDEAGRPLLARTFPKKKGEEMVQLSLFGSGDNYLLERIRKLDIATMTPLEALVELNKLKEYVEGNG